MKDILDKVATSVRRFWKELTVKTLKTSAESYRKSIKVVPEQPTFLHLKLTTKFATMIEKGFKSFDMKPGLLKGKSATTSKFGVPHAVIPIANGVLRTVAPWQTGKWIHPGYRGAHMLPLVKKYAIKVYREELLKKLRRDLRAR